MLPVLEKLDSQFFVATEVLPHEDCISNRSGQCYFLKRIHFEQTDKKALKQKLYLLASARFSETVTIDRVFHS